MKELDGLDVLVTGARRGIGLATAEAARQAGARVWGIGRTAADEPGPFHRFDVVDIENEAAVRGYFERFDEVPWAGLVNNAALALGGPFLEASLADLDRALNTNLRAPFLISQLVAKTMVQREAGSIINLSSVNADRGVTGLSAYSTTKGGIAALTRAMAVELSRHGIRVNAVAPAATDTERLRNILSKADLDARVARIPLGRLVQPEEVANAIVFLLSPRSSFITGQSIAIDGGYLAFGT